MAHRVALRAEPREAVTTRFTTEHEEKKTFTSDRVTCDHAMLILIRLRTPALRRGDRSVTENPAEPSGQSPTTITARRFARLATLSAIEEKQPSLR